MDTSVSNFQTIESQNQHQYQNYLDMGPFPFGPWTSASYRNDPKRFGFILARYKFVAKMLDGKSRILEAGCGDGVGIPHILQFCDHVHGVDIEPLVVKDNQKRFSQEGIEKVSFEVCNLVEHAPEGPFDAVYSLDVIEHIQPEEELKYIENITRNLTSNGVAIIGTPNETADPYTSANSKEGHVNLKSAKTLKQSLESKFHHVFMFSMNDEVVHTGFGPMAHYIFGMGVGLKSIRNTKH